MIGSETFIIVALRCKDRSTSFALASDISSSKYFCNALTLMKVASSTSPDTSDSFGFNTVTFPSAATCSMRAVQGAAISTDFSLAKKSPCCMCATCVFESLCHGPILCGNFFAKFFTGAAALRSEFPSRKTGFTALPRTLEYFSRISRSSGVAGASGNEGISKPFACSSLIHSFNCGIEALILGSFTILAFGVFASSPSCTNSSATRCSGFNFSGNWASTRPATEMSARTMSTCEDFVNALTIGNKE
mmetsp:Transcript_8137/g.19407  ORF Transcript_8137/g.19407 Transcript_8137/m.19407 type:complete len:247 (+) Transcript_8137:1669-2409(+)